jgi:diphthine synthase
MKWANMLAFVGLGLSGEGISLQGLREAKEADAIYAELYTSPIPGLDLKQLERLIGKPIKLVGRNVVEGNPEEILGAARKAKVVFLVPGDPMVATTHVDLRLRAARAGIQTKVVHAASIHSAAPGLAGLQSYKFGRSATVPFPEQRSRTPYEVLAENLERGLHTLLLLDVKGEEGRAMHAREAIEVMLELEAELKGGAFTPETLAVVVARAGSEDALVRADRVRRLLELDFGPPPHVLIVPGRLHFVEAEALKVFGGAPAEAVEQHARART